MGDTIKGDVGKGKAVLEESLRDVVASSILLLLLPMKIFSWNCSGAAIPTFVNNAKSLMHLYQLDVYCFLETRLLKELLPCISNIVGPAL